MFMILKDLIGNAAVMMAGFYVLGKMTNDPISIHSNVREKFRVGYLTAAIGLLLMLFSIQVTDHVMIDLRHVPVMILAYYGGFIPAITSSVLIALSRFLFGINESAIMAFGFMISLGVIMSVIGRYFRKGRYRTILLMNIISMSMITGNLYVLLPDIESFREIIVFFWLIAIPTALLATAFFRDIQNSKKMFIKFKNDAKTDFLTGLANVRQFDNTLNELILASNRRKEDVSLLLIDIDHFKNVNDTFGHDAGDSVLKQLSELLQRNARPTDKVSRNGGEEFSLILPDCSLNTALTIAERIRRAVEGHTFLLPDGREINACVSIGASNLNETASSRDDIFKRADNALYKAKTTGRNKVCTMI
ncbi:diguanylate cyclase [Halobacillus sp. A1]|uniref:GGDEF domain-containing protein n=1 Tax=Halobacillus sp. A1 TaxID=2880262 RepID=UPI0020A64217|nr:diguanylate cyclase [Halobacillus sp. A1]MCP3029897.1 diguanylate cyclase [Halobacillus sp. A1]